MKNANRERISPGAQTVDRACALLREIARTGARGARMLDLCTATSLSRPTAHRILASLHQAGLVRQGDGNKRYALGSGMFELGMATPNPIVRFPHVRSVVEELAAGSNDTVYLMLRSYDDVLCVWRAQGAYPIKANVVALGDRRPLAASVAGLSMLAGLPPEESDQLVQASATCLADFCRMAPSDVQRLVRDARAQGYAVGVNAVMDGVTAVGMAVPGSYQRPYLALSISAINARITVERIPELVLQLRQAAAKIAAITGSDGAR